MSIFDVAREAKNRLDNVLGRETAAPSAEVVPEQQQQEAEAPQQEGQQTSAAPASTSAAVAQAIDEQQGFSGLVSPNVSQQSSEQTQPSNTEFVPASGGANVQPSFASGYVEEAMEDSSYLAGAQSQPKVNANANELEAAAETVNEVIQQQDEEKLEEQRQDLAEEARLYWGDAGIKAAGVVNRPAPSTGITSYNRTYSASRDIHRENVDKKLARATAGTNSAQKNGYLGGLAFNDVLFSDPDLPVDAVSLGLEDVLDSVMDPSSGILQIIQDATGVEMDIEHVLSHPRFLMDTVNAGNIECTLEKSPVNESQSVQTRKLRIHLGKGIGLHPTQAKAFNADFDSDHAVVNLDQANIHKYRRAMTYMLDIEGAGAIDMDFFPIDPISQDQSNDVLESMRFWAFQKYDILTKNDLLVTANEIYPAYKNLCNNGGPVATKKFLSEIYRIAAKHADNEAGVYRDDIAAAMLNALFDFSCLRRSISIKEQVASIVDADTFEEVDEELRPESPLGIVIVDYISDVVRGKPPYNLVEFGAFMHKAFAEAGENGLASGRNIPFRLVADIAKAIHRTDLITIGDPVFGINFEGFKPEDPVPLNVVWAFTCAAIETKRVANRINFGAQELAVSTLVRDQIIRKVGFPDYSQCSSDEDFDKVFRAWLDNFIRTYTQSTRLLNASNVEIRNGMSLSRSKLRFDGINNIVEDLAKPLIEVYGTCTIERIFPIRWKTDFNPEEQGRFNSGDEIWIGYRGMSLLEFSLKNRLRFESETIGKKNMSKKQAIGYRASHGQLKPSDVVFLIADRRTTQFGDFEKAWMSATEQNVKLLSNLEKYRKDKDFDKHADSILEIFHMMSPDMFTFFGIESTDTFARSGHGKALIQAGFAGNVDRSRSEQVSMMIEHRLNRLSGIISDIEEAENALVETGTESSRKRVNALKAAKEYEYDRLGNVSYVWHAIIQEMLDGPERSLFRALIKSKGDINKVIFHRNWDSVAKSFWQDKKSEVWLEESETLLTFLKSDVSYETKMAVLCDITRIRETFRDLLPQHIIGMLACDPDMAHGNSLFDMDLGLKTALDSVKSSVDHISSYADKSIESLKKQNKEFIDEAKKDKARFERWLERLATERGFAVYVPQEVAADLIATVFSKHMPDSEKIKHQPPTNGGFECISEQINGGFVTEMQQTDNRVVNVVGFDQVSFLDLIKVLGDPSIELFTYDRFGVMTKEPVTRASLCGGNSIDDVIKFLEGNPRIAASVRRYMVGVGGGTEGQSVMARFKYSSDEKEEFFDESDDRVWGLLADRPRFYSLVSYLTPAEGDVSRNIAEKTALRIRSVCNDIAEAALDLRNGLLLDLPTFVDEKFHLSEDQMVELLFGADAIPGLYLQERDVKEQRNLAHAIYEMLHYEAIEAISLVAEAKNVELNEDSIQRETLTIKDEYGYEAYSDTREMYCPDRISARAVTDVLQQAGGSRTAKMLPIEGAETKKNMILKVWARNHEPIWGRPGRSDLTGEPIELNGAKYYDDTVDRNPNEQLKPIAKTLEVKREKSAETHNAKTRKYGDDGKNSVVKYSKYTYDSLEEGKTLRRAIDEINEKIRALSSVDGEAASANLAELHRSAVSILADALIKADDEMGYVEDATFSKSDYFNRAEVMLGKNSDGTYVIRTLEQLSAAVNSRLGDEVVFDMSQEEQLSVLEEIVDVVGTDRDPLYRGDATVTRRCFSDIPVRSEVSKVPTIDRAMRPSSSSVERNYELLRNICTELVKIDPAMKTPFPSRQQIEARARSVWSSFNKEMRNLIYGVGFPKSRMNEKGDWVQGNDWSHSYDLLGVASDPNTWGYLVPGPQSLVIFKNSPDENRELFKKCYKYGTTIAFTDMPIDPKIAANCIYTGDRYRSGVYLFPIFDMKLNGFFGDPVMPAPSQFRINRSNYVASIKDTTGEFGPADAGYTATQELVDRKRSSMASSKRPELFTPRDLFPNVLDKFGSADIRVEKCSYDEIKRYIVDQQADSAGRTVHPDYGVSKRTKPAEWKQAKRRYEILIERYRDRFNAGEVDEQFGVLSGDCRHGEIITFAKITVVDGKGPHSYYAPVIPFPQERPGKRPSIYRITQADVDMDSQSYFVNWEYVADFQNNPNKLFEGQGSANKFVAGPKLARSRSLMNGYKIDGFFYDKAVASRITPANARILSMVSMWNMAKLDSSFSYNFGMLPEAFPNDPEIKDKLARNELTAVDWEEFVSSAKDQGREIIYYDGDDEDSRAINSLVKHFVEKCLAFNAGLNPSVLLMSRTADSYIAPPWMTEFEVYMNSSYAFEDAFLKLFHRMQPTLCPNGIEGDSSSTLFKPQIHNDGIDPYGTLLVLVPHWLPDGTSFKALEMLFLSPSFFGEEFTDITKTQANSKNRFLDSLNVATNLSPHDQSLLLEFGRSTASAIPVSAGYMTADFFASPMLSQTDPDFSWDDLLPKVLKEGADYVNIFSKSETDLGKFLSNFSEYPIQTDEGEFRTIEGYWHYIGLPDDCEEKENLKDLPGAEARKLGRSLKKKYGTVNLDNFEERIEQAVRTKLETYPQWMQDSMAGLPLKHYYVYGNKVYDQSDKFKWYIDMVRRVMNELLAKQGQPSVLK